MDTERVHDAGCETSETNSFSFVTWVSLLPKPVEKFHYASRKLETSRLIERLKARWYSQLQTEMERTANETLLK
jgi:hypothetical protein